jgi:transglutaminase/protease-like cytokinesis protein 3
LRLLFTIGFFFTTIFCFAQQNISYWQVDNYVYGIKPTAPKELAQKLTKPFSQDAEKVRAIFRWIATNISYGTNVKIKTKFLNSFDDDTSTVLKSLNERVAENVLQKQLAVCDGYSRLFKTLCDYANIRAEVITGYGRTDRDRISSKFNTNHTWNAVYFDSSWHLLDVTWASGYSSYFNNDYVQSFNEHYYLTEPQEFIKDHYPEDPKWTLLPQIPLLQEYQLSPFKPAGYVRSKIKAYFPTKGIIDAAVGDSILITIETDEKQKNIRVTDIAYNEDVEYDSICTTIKPLIQMQGEKHVCFYVVENANVDFINVVLNDRNTLRYKLNVHQRSIQSTTMK